MKTRHIFSTAPAIFLALTMVVSFSPAAGASDRGYRLGLSDQCTNITFQSADDFETGLGTVVDLRNEQSRSATWLHAKRHPTFSPLYPEDKRFSRSRWHIRWTFTLVASPRADDYGWRGLPG